MPINGITLKKAATGVTIIGGTDAVMKDDGIDVANGIHVVDTTELDMSIRPNSSFKSKAPSYVNGKLTKGKRDFTHVRPKRLTDLSLCYPLFRGSFEIDHEITAAEFLELKLQAVQHIMDSELDDFYTFGTVRV